MVSVTDRVCHVHQPEKGYVSPSKLKIRHFQDDIRLSPVLEYPQLAGMAVDYLTRFLLTGDKIKAFEVSISGAKLANNYSIAEELLNGITGLDRNSIDSAIELVQYDAVTRGRVEVVHIPTQKSEEFLESVRTMVIRSVSFFNKCGPLIDVGFTFEGGYTKVINSGDGDYLTSDTIWDMKVSKYPPTKEQTLQVLTYYILGLNTGLQKFTNVTSIGLFNPLLNQSYSISIDDIDNETIHRVMDEVVGIEFDPPYTSNNMISNYRYTEDVSGFSIESLEDDLSNIFEGRFISSMIPKAEYIESMKPHSLAAILVLGTSQLYRGNIPEAEKWYTKANRLSEGTDDQIKVDKSVEEAVVRFFVDYCKDSTMGLSPSISTISKFLKSYPRNQFKLILQDLTSHEYEMKSAESVANLFKCILVIILCENIKNEYSGTTYVEIRWALDYSDQLIDRLFSKNVTSCRNISSHLNRLEKMQQILTSIIDRPQTSSEIMNPQSLIEEVIAL